MLGLRSIHYDQVRLNDVVAGTNPRPLWRRYDDIDAVMDLPAALFYRELLDAYPGCRAILTTRDVESWWRSVQRLVDVDHPARPSWARTAALETLYRLRLRPSRFDGHRFGADVLKIAYGSHHATEYLYKKRFVEHNERVQREIPRERLLILNIVQGDGWETLCPFLGVSAPKADFPHVHRTVWHRDPDP